MHSLVVYRFPLQQHALDTLAKNFQPEMLISSWSQLVKAHDVAGSDN